MLINKFSEKCSRMMNNLVGKYFSLNLSTTFKTELLNDSFDPNDNFFEEIIERGLNESFHPHKTKLHDNILH